MIVLNLACANSHEFEGWFASAEEFARQAETRLVSCPYCNDLAITRLPTGPHVKRKAQQDGSKADELVEALAQMAQHSENVGAEFPEEARKIHYQETAPRSIRGIASSSEVKALIDEGIAVLPIPLPPKDRVH